jgi:hypothetical protein
MRVGGRKVILCDCEGTMALDAPALAVALGGERPLIASQLCRREQGRLRAMTFWSRVPRSGPSSRRSWPRPRARPPPTLS